MPASALHFLASMAHARATRLAAWQFEPEFGALFIDKANLIHSIGVVQPSIGHYKSNAF